MVRVTRASHTRTAHLADVLVAQRASPGLHARKRAVRQNCAIGGAGRTNLHRAKRRAGTMTIRSSLLLLLSLSASTAAQTRTGRVNVGDAAINYELTGRGEAVVLVHGWANTLAIWDDQVPAFSQRYQVLRYDRRGFGRS